MMLRRTLLLVVSLMRAKGATMSLSRRAALSPVACAPFLVVSRVSALEPVAARRQVDASLAILTWLVTDDAAFQSVVAGGGDNLRRELGFVGTGSPLFSIDKPLLFFMGDVADSGEYNERYEQFILALRAADADAYSANFIEFSASKGTPAGYFKSARKELKVAQESLAAMANMLNS